MKALLISFTAAAALAAAAPAAAQYGSQQPYGSQPYGNRDNVDQNRGFNIADRIDRLQERLDAGIAAGTIDRTQARSLRQQIRQLDRLEVQYSRNGLSPQERQDLQQRIRNVRRDLRLADSANDSRYGDWDRWDREDGYGQSQGNQYGWQNGGQSGRYQEVSQACTQQRSGVGAILGAILGADNCLRVGERVSRTSSLSALPSQYRDEFRDRSGYTYRYLDGNVIEIDTRTSVVTRIYDVI